MMSARHFWTKYFWVYFVQGHFFNSVFVLELILLKKMTELIYCFRQVVTHSVHVHTGMHIQEIHVYSLFEDEFCDKTKLNVGLSIFLCPTINLLRLTSPGMSFRHCWISYHILSVLATTIKRGYPLHVTLKFIFINMTHKRNNLLEEYFQVNSDLRFCHFWI